MLSDCSCFLVSVWKFCWLSLSDCSLYAPAVWFTGGYVLVLEAHVFQFQFQLKMAS